MVIQFTIGNFLSFKEQSILSLAASALKEVQVPAEDIIFSVGTAGLSLMKSAVVYGANFLRVELLPCLIQKKQIRKMLN